MGSCLLGLALVASSAGAQPPPAYREARAFAERAAHAQAVRQLTSRIFTLPITAGETLADRVGDQAQMDAELRFLIASARRVGPGRHFSDRTCEVDVQLAADDLARQVERLAREYLQDPPTHLSAEAIRQAAGEHYLYGTGCVDEPRPDQLEDLRNLPAGCEGLLPNGPALARQAAELDAFYRLGRNLARLVGDPSQPRGEYLRRAEKFADLLMAEPAGITIDQVTFHPGAICTLRVSVPVERLEQILRQAGKELDRRILQDWLEQLRGSTQGRPMEATGYGVPPASAWQIPRQLWVDVDPPPWVGRTLGVAASVHLPQVERAASDPQAVAAAAARVEGIRQLAQQVDALALSDGVKVAAFLARHEDLARDVAMFLSSTRALAPASYDPATATASVRLALPLQRLWRILKTRMVPIEVGPPGAVEADSAEEP